MATFATFTPTGTAFDTIQSIDANWSANTSSPAGNFLIGSGGSGIITNASGVYLAWQYNATPTTEDYTVWVTLNRPSPGDASTGQCGASGRNQSGANTFVSFLYINSANELRLYDWVAGTPTQLGAAVSFTLSDDTPVRVGLVMAGDQVSVVDTGGTPIVSARTTTIVSPTYGAGKPGIVGTQMRTSGAEDNLRFNLFTAEESGGGGGGSSFRRTSSITGTRAGSRQIQG